MSKGRGGKNATVTRQRAASVAKKTVQSVEPSTARAGRARAASVASGRSSGSQEVLDLIERVRDPNAVDNRPNKIPPFTHRPRLPEPDESESDQEEEGEVIDEEVEDEEPNPPPIVNKKPVSASVAPTTLITNTDTRQFQTYTNNKLNGKQTVEEIEKYRVAWFNYRSLHTGGDEKFALRGWVERTSEAWDYLEANEVRNASEFFSRLIQDAERMPKAKAQYLTEWYVEANKPKNAKAHINEADRLFKKIFEQQVAINKMPNVDSAITSYLRMHTVDGRYATDEEKIEKRAQLREEIVVMCTEAIKHQLAVCLAGDEGHDSWTKHEPGSYLFMKY